MHSFAEDLTALWMAVEIEVDKMSFILFNQGGRSIARIPLVGRPLHIGSSPAMDFTLPDKSLPACLCRFEPLGLLDYHLKTDLPESPHSHSKSSDTEF